MKFLLLSFIFLLSCSVNKTRRNFITGEVIIDGGSYQNLTWKEQLKFKRYTWFNEASMKYDILLTQVTNSSKFATWMGRDRSKLLNCRKLMIGLIYTDHNSAFSKPHIVSQFEKTGYSDLILVDFNTHLKSHHSYRDWKLSEYKVVGFCKKDENTNVVKIDIPGFGIKELN